MTVRPRCTFEGFLGEYILKDRKSKHGTYLNGARIHEVALHPGDRIQLGGLRGQVVTFRQKNSLKSLIGTGSLSSNSLSVRDFREMGLLMATILKLIRYPLWTT